MYDLLFAKKFVFVIRENIIFPIHRTGVISLNNTNFITLSFAYNCSALLNVALSTIEKYSQYLMRNNYPLKTQYFCGKQIVVSPK